MRWLLAIHAFRLRDGVVTADLIAHLSFSAKKPADLSPHRKRTNFNAQVQIPSPHFRDARKYSSSPTTH
jgi:hypothetical protein